MNIFRERSGFTLLELIVVMAVVAILVAMGVPRFIGYQKDAKVSAMKADCKVLEDACSIYHTEKDVWPILGEYVPAEGSIVELLSGATVNKLNKAMVSPHIRSLKNGLNDYALVTVGNENVSEGDIVYTGNSGAGLPDRRDDIWYGINLQGFNVGEEFVPKTEVPEGWVGIYTPEDLLKIKDRHTPGHPDFDYDISYIQMADIDMSGKEWAPIGTGGPPFMCEYDGNGYKISNLRSDLGGLFSDVSGATITNVHIEDIQVAASEGSSKSGVGGLVGFGVCDISNCTVTGSIEVNNDTYCGGVFGFCPNDSNITDCKFSGNVFVDNGGTVGGIGGLITDSVISNCRAVGFVNGRGKLDYGWSAAVGGVIGKAADSQVTKCSADVDMSCNLCVVGGFAGLLDGGVSITECYAVGSINTTGKCDIGGFLGSCGDDNEVNNCYAHVNIKMDGAEVVGGFAGTIADGHPNNCYATGSITGSPSPDSGPPYYIGGFSGISSKYTPSCFYNKDNFSFPDSCPYVADQGVTPLTTEEMKSIDTYAGWDFSSIWAIDEGISYPYLRNNKQVPHPK